MDSTQFDIDSGALYIAMLAAPIVGVTYIESSHSLGAGLMAGLFGSVLLIIVGVWTKRSIR
jgi:hypothetical protein